MITIIVKHTLLVILLIMLSLVGCSNEQHYLELGNKKYDSEEYDTAISNYNRAVEINPKNPAAYYLRGLAHYKKGEKQQAIIDISESIQLSGGFKRAYINRGVILNEVGRFNDALNDYESALSLKPGDLEIRTLRAYTLFKKGDYKAADREYTDLILEDPDNSKLYRGRADARYQIHSYGGAISDYSKALEISPNDRYILNNLAWLYATSYDDKYRDGRLAIKLAKRSLALNPSDTGYDTYAAALAEIGEFTEAISIIEGVLEKGNKNPILLERLEKYKANQPIRSKEIEILPEAEIESNRV